MKKFKLFSTLVVAVFVVGCSDAGDELSTVSVAETEVARLSSQQAAEKIKAAVPEVVRLVPVTEDNDPNNLIGRPNGYEGGTIIFDNRVSCDSETEGTECGALIEQWPTEADARQRAEYINGVRKAMPMLGTEYQTIRDGLLLRVDGDLKPSEAKVYQEAFES